MVPLAIRGMVVNKMLGDPIPVVSSWAVKSSKILKRDFYLPPPSVRISYQILNLTYTMPFSIGDISRCNMEDVHMDF